MLKLLITISGVGYFFSSVDLEGGNKLYFKGSINLQICQNKNHICIRTAKFLVLFCVINIYKVQVMIRFATSQNI